MTKGSKVTEKTRARMRLSARRSWASGTRRKERTKEQIRVDKIVTLNIVEEARKVERYRQAAEKNREHWRWVDECEERARIMNLPKGVRSLGHGPVLPRPAYLARSEGDAWGRRIVFV